MVSLYNKIPDMECISGDTLPIFEVSVEAESLENCRMQCVLSKASAPENTLICKDCNKIDGGFSVILTSEDTGKLAEGTYIIYFRLTDSAGFDYIKLCGNLYVRSGPDAGGT